MPKCHICKKRKAQFHCVSASADICPTCCKTHTDDFFCFGSCEHLKQNKDNTLLRKVNLEVLNNFNEESEDIFQDKKAPQFAGPLEYFIVYTFYDDESVNDFMVYFALVKIFAFLQDKLTELKPSNTCEEVLFPAFIEINNDLKELKKGFKAKIILRILKSISKSSGGVLGDRNYLEMLYNQFFEDEDTMPFVLDFV